MKRITATLVLVVMLFISLNAISYTKSFNYSDLSVSTNSRKYLKHQWQNYGLANVW